MPYGDTLPGGLSWREEASDCCPDHSARRAQEHTGPLSCLGVISAPGYRGDRAIPAFLLCICAPASWLTGPQRWELANHSEEPRALGDRALSLAAHSGV